MSLADRLFEKARQYEQLAASYDERAPLVVEGQGDWQLCAVAWTVVAIALRELGSVLDGEDELL